LTPLQDQAGLEGLWQLSPRCRTRGRTDRVVEGQFFAQPDRGYGPTGDFLGSYQLVSETVVSKTPVGDYTVRVSRAPTTRCLNLNYMCGSSVSRGAGRSASLSLSLVSAPPMLFRDLSQS
jgi:hypothetical protein